MEEDAEPYVEDGLDSHHTVANSLYPPRLNGAALFHLCGEIDARQCHEIWLDRRPCMLVIEPLEEYGGGGNNLSHTHHTTPQTLL